MPDTQALPEITPEYLKEYALKFKPARIKHVEYNGVDMIFRAPTRTECQQHQAKIDDPNQKAEADEQLAQLLLVRFDNLEGVAARMAFNEMLEEFGYMCKSPAIGGALSKLTGVVEDDSAKKSRLALMSKKSLPSNTPGA